MSENRFAKYREQTVEAAPQPVAPTNRFAKYREPAPLDGEVLPPEKAAPQSERDPLIMQGLGKFTEGLAGLPGVPLDLGFAGGNFIRRQFDIPETPLDQSPLKNWGSEGWSNAVMGAAGIPKVAAPTNDAERVVQKAGLFFGGAAPFGPAALLPTAAAVGGSEVGRAADQAMPDVTKGYGEVAGALAGGLTPSAARRSLVPRTTPEQATIAQELMHNDVPVYPGQLATNHMTRNAYDLSNKLSVYDNLADARQSDAVTRMLSRTMGEDETNLRHASANANARLGGVPDPQRPVGPKLHAGEYDQIYARIGNHRIDTQAVGELQTLEQRALQLTDRSRATVEHALDSVHSTLDANGLLSIRGFKDLTDQGGVLSELANSQNPAVALYGQQLRQILENNIRRQAGPADAQALQTADSQWRHMKTLEPTIAASANAEGQISPSLLQGRVAVASNRSNARGASGTPVLETVGQAGKSFLKPPRSSGTAERSAILNLATSGGPGAAVGALVGGPVGAAVGAGIGVGAPLATRFVLQRQWLTRMMIDDALRRGANPSTIRRMLTRAAPTLPGATQQQLPAPRRMLTRAAAPVAAASQQP